MPNVGEDVELLELSLLVAVYMAQSLWKIFVGISYVYSHDPAILHLDISNRYEGLSSSKHVQEC